MSSSAAAPGPLAPPGATADRAAAAVIEHMAHSLRAVGLSVAVSGDMLAVAVADAYEACIRVLPESAEIILWEQLMWGTDPGVRDFVRRTAERGWQVKVSLHPPDHGG